MKLLEVAFKDVRLTIRDKKALLILIAMPFIIISILGMALSDVFGGSPTISKYDVAVVDIDQGDIAELFIEETLKSKELKELLNVTDLSEAEATKRVKQGDLAAVIIIPVGFSKSVNEGQGGILEILGDPGQQIRVAIVEGITTSFAQRVSAVTIGVTTPIQILLNSQTISPTEIDQTIGQLAPEMTSAVENPVVEVTERKEEVEEEISAIQYYSAGMAVMFILFSAMYGAFSLLDERNNMTLARLLSTPTSKFSILGGKLVGTFFVGVLQFTALVVATRLIFGVQWGESILGIIILVVATVLASTGMSIFIASIAKTTKAAAAMSQMLIQGMAALGGSMIPLAVFPDWMKNISQFTINYWAIDGFTQLMDGASWQATLLPAGILIGISTAFLALGIWRFKYE